MRKFILGICLLWSANVWSAPVAWSFDSLGFGIAGGTAFGSFDYDADTNTYSNISITTAYDEDGTDIFATYTYLSSNDLYPASATSLPVVLSGSTDLTGSYGIELWFSEALTNTGGTVSIMGGFEGLCDNPNCTSYDYEWPWREVLPYSGTVSAVPIPAAVWLFGSALAGLGWLRRKQTA